jgi:hypothetical protein
MGAGYTAVMASVTQWRHHHRKLDDRLDDLALAG